MRALWVACLCACGGNPSTMPDGALDGTVIDAGDNVGMHAAYIKASNPQDGAEFCRTALSADGLTLAVGASGESSNATGVNGNQADASAGRSGAVYVFTRSGATWVQQAYLKASNTGASDFFGLDLALAADGNTLVVGANGEASANVESDNSLLSAGAAYVFVRSGTTWTQQAYLKAPHPDTIDSFGGSVAIASDGNTIAIGSGNESSNATGIGGDQTNNLASGSGAVYVFTRASATWTLEAYVKASNTNQGDRFGKSVGLSSDGSTLAVSADGEASASTGIDGNQQDNTKHGAGAVYIFVRTGGVWGQTTYIKSTKTAMGQQFGWELALAGDGNTLAVSARLEASATGAVYVFARAAGTWAQQADLTAMNAEIDDHFSGELALSSDGTTLAVGAPEEDSSGASPDDNSRIDSGAAYLFGVSGGMWSQTAYLKASNIDPDDRFGEGIALSGDGHVLAIGAVREDSAATGVDGAQTDNSVIDSGAVYVRY